MPEALRQHGFSVTAVGTVTEALDEITSAQFDVLISDLNFDHPADGFIVVSAMRRTQPNCVTLILTGYPGFESTLEALRNHVDGYLIKPAQISTLVSLIHEKLQQRNLGLGAATKRIALTLRENTFEMPERRRNQRLLIQGTVIAKVNDRQFTGVSRDMSPRGLYFFTDEGIAEGSGVEVEIRLPPNDLIESGSPVSIRGEGHVVRVQQTEANGPFGIAAALANIEILQ
jgi:CheY-like chemotaxis protein